MHYSFIIMMMTRFTASQMRRLIASLGLGKEFLREAGSSREAQARALFKLFTSPSGPGERVLYQAVLGVLGLKASLVLAGDLGARANSPSILVLPANPLEMRRSELEEQCGQIERRMKGTARQHVSIKYEMARTDSQLHDCLVKYRPTIVHFAGQGASTGEVVLQGPGRIQMGFSKKRLDSIFESVADQTKCVVLNACYSAAQARDLGRRVQFVTGIPRDVGDLGAARFNSGFYNALADGEDYSTAIQKGSIAVHAEALPDLVLPRVHTGTTELIAESHKSGIELVTVGDTSQVDTERDDLYSLPRLYTVWFGTNRKPTSSRKASETFSAERDEEIHYGTCEVYLPKGHRTGSVGTKWWKRLPKLKFTSDWLEVRKVHQMMKDDYWKSVREAVASFKKQERMALVFIHGFNVDFEEAAMRAAQMGFDLKIPGVVAFFSWPSKGNVKDYGPDGETIGGSEQYITKFLVDFSHFAGVERVHVLAHSMGNLGFLRAVERIVGRASRRSRVKFEQIVLAAPDVDRDLFTDLAPNCLKICKRTTLYMSEKDKALRSAGIIKDFPRAGFSPPPTILKGIDTIEVSGIDLTFLGHGYYAAARPFLNDLQSLLLSNLAPRRRSGLLSQKTPKGERYWVFNA
jgi:esterase/lipase superfamily enzyme